MANVAAFTIAKSHFAFTFVGSADKTLLVIFIRQFIQMPAFCTFTICHVVIHLLRFTIVFFPFKHFSDIGTLLAKPLSANAVALIG